MNQIKIKWRHSGDHMCMPNARDAENAAWYIAFGRIFEGDVMYWTTLTDLMLSGY